MHDHAHCLHDGLHHDSTLQAERLTRWAFALNALGMAAEVAYGLLTGSMSLLADGLHMASDAVALGIALFAYAYARKHAQSPAFAFGAGKINALAGFASAVLMAVVTLYLAVESVIRLVRPEQIDYGPALAVAALGLAVNAACAFFLHGHAHENAHDHNLRAAYLHLLADALTSLFAIGALLGGRYLGMAWLDPVGGLLGALVIARWAIRLIHEAGRVLLDRIPDPALVQAMTRLIERDGQARVRHMALWRVSPTELACVVSLEDASPRPPEHYKALMSGIEGLSRVTVEVHPSPCPSETTA
jgi:cation diffusion facilitator family transporter